MNVTLYTVNQNDLSAYKKDMQAAFQIEATAQFLDLDIEILPEKEIDLALLKKGAFAYKAIIDGEMVGGAVVVID